MVITNHDHVDLRYGLERRPYFKICIIDQNTIGKLKMFISIFLDFLRQYAAVNHESSGQERSLTTSLALLLTLFSVPSEKLLYIYVDKVISFFQIT